MARQSDELLAAWRALAGPSVADGWRTIPISPAGACQVLAGRAFPGDLEAVLFRFDTNARFPSERLPEGHGFSVTRGDPQLWGDAGTWLALSRKQDGRLDLFVAMVEDVFRALEASPDASSARATQTFLDRIYAWQAFMQRSAAVLSPEAELGLMGELFLLRDLLEAGVSPQDAVEAWQGPLDGLHDFVLGPGAIEVKCTLAPEGFTAKVLSLEQLDEAQRSPLLLAGFRLLVDSTGLRLPELLKDLSAMLGQESGAASTFHERYLAAGYSDAFSEHYTRRFLVVESALYPVAESFPRLTRSSVPIGVVNARYEISLARLSLQTVPLLSVLQQIGVTSK